MNKLLKNKKALIVGLLTLGIVLITTGVTVAWFSYSRNGVKENSITTGSITFHYQEDTNGLTLEDAMPKTDAQGKTQSEVFDFRVTSSVGAGMDIPYVVTAKVDAGNTLPAEYVKVYLSDQSNNQIEAPRVFSSLANYSHGIINTTGEKVIYEGIVPRNSANYSKLFRLRMWMSDDIDMSPVDVTNYFCDGEPATQEEYNSCSGEQTTTTTQSYPYNNNTFKITVNVYSEGEASSDEAANAKKNANIEELTVSNFDSIQIDSTHYESDVLVPEGSTSVTIPIVVDTVNDNATVTIEEIDSVGTVIKESGIKKLSSTKNVTVTLGTHYFKITIRPEDKSDPTIYYLTVNAVNKLAGLFDDNDNLVATWSQLTSAGFSLTTTSTNNNSNILNTYTNGTKLVIPDGETTIDRGAFYEASKLKSIELPDTITSINFATFFGCSSLISIDIPASAVDATASTANYFEYCSKLEEINVDSDNTTLKSINGVLYNKDMTRLLKYPQAKSDVSYNVLSGVETIHRYAFRNVDAITEITLPNSLLMIEEGAFQNCNFTEITIPSSVTEIKSKAFADSELTSINLSNGLDEIGSEAFAGTKIVALTIPSTVTYVGGKLVKSSTTIQTITFADPYNWKRSCSGSSCSTIYTLDNPTTNATNLKATTGLATYGYKKVSQ